MAKGVGKAFEKALAKRDGKIPEDGKGHVGRFEFGNRNRREIIQFLCSHPCSHISNIAEELGLSVHTVSWHLRRLVDGGYLSRAKVGKKTVFYPADMIQGQDIVLFEALNNRKAKSMYLAIMDHEGINQQEICRKLSFNHQAVIWYTRKFESLGLVRSVEDGKYRRYYPTDMLKRKKDEYTPRIRMFRNGILKRLKKEKHSYEILRSTEDKLVVKVEAGGEKAVLNLDTNPFITVLM